MTPTTPVVRRLGIMVLATWPMFVAVAAQYRDPGALLGAGIFAVVTVPVGLLAWRGRTRLRRAASFVGASVLFGAWASTALWLVTGLHTNEGEAGGGGMLGLFDDPIRDLTAAFSLAMLLSGLVGAALLSLIEWAWEHLERRRAAARVGSDTPS